MGFRDFIDAVLGRSRLPKAKTDKLFAISTASITLESNLGLKSSGAAGICFKPIDASAYESARKEIQELLEYSSKETKTEFRLEKDEFNFLWAIFKDLDFEDLLRIDVLREDDWFLSSTNLDTSVFLLLPSVGLCQAGTS